jgi:hypothetical protein
MNEVPTKIIMKKIKNIFMIECTIRTYIKQEKIQKRFKVLTFFFFPIIDLSVQFKPRPCPLERKKRTFNQLNRHTQTKIILFVNKNHQQ